MAKEPTRELVMIVVEEALEAKGFPPGEDEERETRLDMAFLRRCRLFWEARAGTVKWAVGLAFAALIGGWLR
jgi:hypothetical protein